MAYQPVVPAVSSMSTVTPEQIAEYRKSASESARQVEQAANVDTINADVVQFLAIGQVNPLAVFTAAEALRVEQANYAVGRVFDVITESMRDYAEFVNELATSLRPTDVITDFHTTPRKGLVSRQQVMIDSGLITELDDRGNETGAKYFKVRRRTLLANGTNFGWTDTTERGGHNVEHKLYVYDLKAQKFAFLLANGDVLSVGLGAPAVWDAVIRDIHETPNLAKAEAILNALPVHVRDFLVRDDEGKQKLFWTVFKDLKVEDTPAAPAAKATAKASA